MHSKHFFNIRPSSWWPTGCCCNVEGRLLVFGVESMRSLRSLQVAVEHKLYIAKLCCIKLSAWNAIGHAHNHFFSDVDICCCFLRMWRHCFAFPMTVDVHVALNNSSCVSRGIQIGNLSTLSPFYEPWTDRFFLSSWSLPQPRLSSFFY